MLSEYLLMKLVSNFTIEVSRPYTFSTAPMCTAMLALMCTKNIENTENCNADFNVHKQT